MDKREIFIIGLLLLLCLILYFWLQYLAANVYFSDTTFDVTQQRIHNLYNMNIGLRDQLLFDESYTKIASEAASRGYQSAPFVPL